MPPPKCTAFATLSRNESSQPSEINFYSEDCINIRHIPTAVTVAQQEGTFPSRSSPRLPIISLTGDIGQDNELTIAHIWKTNILKIFS